jgi:hypothetical protein
MPNKVNKSPLKMSVKKHTEETYKQLDKSKNLKVGSPDWSKAQTAAEKKATKELGYSRKEAADRAPRSAYDKATDSARTARFASALPKEVKKPRRTGAGYAPKPPRKK